MAEEIKVLDPVQGLIDYTNDVKPYHSKVIEALIEYVATDFVEIVVLDTLAIDFELIYTFDENLFCGIGGFGTPSFGDPLDIIVSSPDISQTLQEYPALSSGFFIVLGDRRDVFDSVVDLDLFITSRLEEKLIDVQVSTGSPLSGGSFTIKNDKTTNYSIGVAFKVVGSAFNDGDYTASNVTVLASPLRTVIEVNEIVTTNNVEGFVSLLDPVNTGIFAPAAAVYEEHHLLPHTTVFTTGISLVLPPPAVDENQRYVSYVNTQPLTYNQVLGYSKALREFVDGSPPGTFLAADEGISISDIVGVTPTSFSVLGDFRSSNIFVDDIFVVQDSSSNNGEYIITDLEYVFNGSVNAFVTKFSVASVPDSITINGSLVLQIPSNVFIIEGSDYTKFFTQGARVNVTTGSHIGTYTTLNSKYINDKTYVRVRETLIDEGTGRNILSATFPYIAVDGDVTAIYTAGQKFNIVTSDRNDGSYTTTSSVYDGLTNTTQISIAEPFDDTDNTGEIHEFEIGSITFLPSGFGAALDFCELVPETLARASILEDFDFLLGYRFEIDGTESGADKIYIKDNIAGDVFNILADLGSFEIVSSGINNGTYTINNLLSDPGVHAILEVTPSVSDSGIFSGSPAISSGFGIYKEWFQYLIVNIEVGPNNFLVTGDATGDISMGMTIKTVEPENFYTVDAAPTFDGINTTISVTEVIVSAGGSPPLSQWIISV